MIFDNYEISLWTHNDNFNAILGATGAYYKCEAYDPIYNYKTDGEETLTFTIPIIYLVQEAELLGYFDLQTLSGVDAATLPWYETVITPAVNCYLSDGQLISVSPHIIINDQGYAVIDNSTWYSILTNNSLLANEKKIKLIFDKGTANERIKEFVIINLIQERDGASLYCKVECGSLAFYELGKTGYNLTFNEDVILLEEEEIETLIYPTLDYWMNKLFPIEENSGKNAWEYSIEMDYSEIFNGADSEKVYEEPGIISWEGENAPFTPIYRTELAEKCRYPKIEKSNKYNICQDLAELYGVYVRIEYEHSDLQNPYKITNRRVIFYNKPYINTEYSITYGDNETSIRKISDSKELVTKLYVEDVESKFSNSGLISISEAEANKSKDNFILNFDYYEQAGMLSESQEDAIHGDTDSGVVAFEDALREKNLALEIKFKEKYGLQNDRLDVEIKLAVAQDKATSALDVANDYEDKLLAFNNAISDHTLTDTRVAYLVLGTSPNQYINFRRNGIAISTFTIYKADNTQLTTPTHYTPVLNSYGNLTGVRLTVAAGVTTGQLLYCTYDYDLFSFYTNEKITYVDVYNTNTILATSLENILTIIDNNIVTCDNNIDTLLSEKTTIINDFNTMMGYFLREGSWSTNDYLGPYQQKTLTNINFTPDADGNKIYYDTVARDGEDLAYYMVGETKTYYNFVEMTGISYTDIENLELVETDPLGEPIKRYLFGAHFKPQYCNFTTSPIGNRMVLILDQNIAVTLGNGLYYNNTNIITNYKIGQANHEIIYRRILLADKKLLINSLEITVDTTLLTEFYDYSLFVDADGNTIITLKINNNVPGNLTGVDIDYKSDRTVEQLYWDALEVSKRSAFPDAKYEVEFVYLQKALNTQHTNTAIVDYQSITTNLNNNIELELASIVRINDYELELRGVKGVVTEITLALEEPQNNSFVVQNYKTRFEDIFSRIVASTEQMNARGLAYERAATAITPTNSIIGSVLQNAINNNNILFSSGIASDVVFGPQGIVVENLAPYTNGVKGQVVIKGGGIFLSDRLDDDGLNRIYTSAITPTGINAAILTTGRLDTERVNIYAGNQIRFTWKADGIFAYSSSIFGIVNYNEYVKYNEEGLFLSALIGETRVDRVEVSWNGFILRNNYNEEVFFADPDTGNLSITGILTATGGVISGDMTVSGSLGSPNFTSGALGNGWRVDGDGSAQFNNVYVRGTISATVFEYDEISCVGGSLYVAPVLISLNEGDIGVNSNYYTFTIAHSFSGAHPPYFSAGRDWAVNDLISLQGFIYYTSGGITTFYELKDIQCKITVISATSLTIQTQDLAADVLGYDEDDVTHAFDSDYILQTNASLIYLGTVSGTTILRKGILLTTNEEYSPYIDIYDQTLTNSTPKVRLGNLSGITDVNFGPTPLSGYGLYSQNAYLTGTMLVVSPDNSSAMMLTSEGFKIASGKIAGNWDWSTFGTGEGFTADLITTGELNAGVVKILGTTQFYWDADNIYILNTANQDNQIRLGRYDGTNYGIGFTEDAGTTWETILGFNSGHLGLSGATLTWNEGTQTVEILAGAKINILSGGDLVIKSGADLDIESGGNINIAAGGDFLISSGGNVDISAGATYNLRSGTGSSAIGMSNNEEDSYFLWAGNADPALAPFSIKMDGTIQNVGNAYVQTITENADSTHGVILDVYFPEDVSLIDKVLLSVKFTAFRAYSTGAASGGTTTSDNGGGITTSSDNGGGISTTTEAGGGQTSSSESEKSYTSASSATTTSENSTTNISIPSLEGQASTGSSGTGATGYPSEASTSGNNGQTSTEDSHYHNSGSLSADTYNGSISGNTGTHSSHYHLLNDHTHSMMSHTHSGPSHYHNMAHYHWLPQHTHGLNSHKHSVTIDAHSHTVDNHQHNISFSAHNHTITLSAHSHTIQNHTHGIVYGIYIAPTDPTSVTILIDGTTIWSGQAAFINRDVAPYFSQTNNKITRNMFHTIEIRPNILGRVSAHLYIKTTQISKVAGVL